LNSYFSFINKYLKKQKTPTVDTVRVILAFRLRINLSMRDFTGDYLFPPISTSF